MVWLLWRWRHENRLSGSLQVLVLINLLLDERKDQTSLFLISHCQYFLDWEGEIGDTMNQGFDLSPMICFHHLISLSHTDKWKTTALDNSTLSQLFYEADKQHSASGYVCVCVWVQESMCVICIHVCTTFNSSLTSTDFAKADWGQRFPLNVLTVLFAQHLNVVIFMSKGLAHGAAQVRHWLIQYNIILRLYSLSP